MPEKRCGNCKWWKVDGASEQRWGECEWPIPDGVLVAISMQQQEDFGRRVDMCWDEGDCPVWELKSDA